MPKVSVIMNCYNGEKYLREAIDSIYAQTCDDFEIIFWDNCSIDSSPEIAKSYDYRLRYFRGTETIPLGAARRLAVMEAKGSWIAILDSDDFWYPNKLATQLAAVENKDYILCYAGIKEIDQNGNILNQVLPQYESGWMLEQQLFQFDINMQTPLISHSALVEFDLNFDENITASEEYNLFLRLAAKGKVCAVSEILGVYRVYSGSLTERQISQWSLERLYTLDQLKRENPGIDDKYPKAFREAQARGNYYKARYEISAGRLKEAKITMSEIKYISYKYLFLYFCMYLPGLWPIIHGHRTKRVLSNFMKLIKL